MTTQEATARFVRMAPRKVRAIADVIRGLSAREAEAELLLQRRRAAKPILKLLRSAMANAKNNQKANPDQMVVERIRVDHGPMLKRYLPRARGSASPIEKKSSHITIVLAEHSALKPPRFIIVVPKKEKKAPKEEKRPKRERKTTEDVGVRQAKKSGFLRRIFSRKSGM